MEDSPQSGEDEIVEPDQGNGTSKIFPVNSNAGLIVVMHVQSSRISSPNYGLALT
jgi:hypothetical protein